LSLEILIALILATSTQSKNCSELSIFIVLMAVVIIITVVVIIIIK